MEVYICDIFCALFIGRAFDLQAARLIDSRLMSDTSHMVILHFITKTRRRMARERRGAGSSLVSMETPYYKTIY